MPKTQTGHKPITLHFQNAQRVMVVPDDKDRFFTTVGEAARACKQAQDNVEWAEQWNDFLAHIHRWCADRSQDVDAGYVMVGDGLTVLICVSIEDYNFDLEDALTDLDLELSERFPLCCAEVMQIPNQRDLRAGLPDEAILVVYGDGQRTSAAS